MATAFSAKKRRKRVFPGRFLSFLMEVKWQRYDFMKSRNKAVKRRGWHHGNRYGII
ncbi:hypothetical protein SUBVAR_05593 [Subdoligranulum variabile DSM 15176]|uniref:Uncharacterized protein n=1 Tax=Subdoligranulum variabile DSM 15176 TaxID=411471 RepID=D1PMN0_9FIRM|nr:hypothetical protein SUBVAR_05593 [Subdoligranulum variabile DSM 15176]